MRIPCLADQRSVYRIGRRDDGFTVIETMLVIAIVGIISSIAIPNLIEARKGANEAAAFGAMRTLVTAQSLFRESNKDKNYASAIGMLRNANLINNQLGTGRDHGYTFYLTTIPERTSWSAVAASAAVNRTGDRMFFVNESGIIQFVQCPPGQTYDAQARRCQPADTLLDSFGFAAIRQLDAMSGGVALALAKERLQSEALVRTILNRLDADGDGQLTFGESLNADLHAVLPGVLHDIGEHGSAGDVAALVAVYHAYARGLRTDLALGIANENTLPAVQLTALQGNVIAFLNGIGLATTSR